MSDPAGAKADETLGKFNNPKSFKLSNEKLKLFMDVKLRTRQCEVCFLQNTWSVTGPEGRFENLLSNDGEVIHPLEFTRSHTYLAVYCTSCGNTKLLLAPVIWRWLEKNGHLADETAEAPVV